MPNRQQQQLRRLSGDKLAHVEPRWPSEGKHKLLANVAMSVLLYGTPIWADAISAKEYRRTEMVLVLWKAVLRCISAYHTVSIEAVCILAGVPSIELAVDECKRVCSATCEISSRSGKAFWVRCDERQVTLHKWEEWPLGNSKGEWTCLFIYNHKYQKMFSHFNLV